MRRYWMVICPNGHGFKVAGDEQPARNFEAPYGQDLPPFPALAAASCPHCGEPHTGERFARRCMGAPSDTPTAD